MKTRSLIPLTLACALIAPASLSAARGGKEPMKASVTRKANYGKLPDGTAIDEYTLTNAKGVVCKVITYGAIITELHVPDRDGTMGDVVLGFDNLQQYLDGHPYFGAAIGRVGNRIAKGKFTLNGKLYTLATNNGPNHLHGGIKGFDKVVWTAEPMQGRDNVGVRFSYISPDGEEGYPGTLKVIMTYTLTDKNELRIDYQATTDRDTILNLTNHSYFNLAGKGDILGHELMLKAKNYTPVDDTLIPTGEIKAVKGGPMDFTKAKPIGRDIKQLTNDPQGYDHNFALDSKGRKMALAARVYDPTTGRVMEVRTDQPGVQFYSGNFLDGTLKGKGGVVYNYQNGLCLETQHFPDSINHPNFPSVVLRPGQTYKTSTVYTFSTKK